MSLKETGKLGLKLNRTADYQCFLNLYYFTLFFMYWFWDLILCHFLYKLCMYLISSFLAILVFFSIFLYICKRFRNLGGSLLTHWEFYYLLLSFRFLDCSVKEPNCYIPLSLNKSASFFIFEKKERDEKKIITKLFDIWQLNSVRTVMFEQSHFIEVLQSLLHSPKYTFQPAQSSDL